MKAEQLSYNDMAMSASGCILSHEAKAALRKQHGYCVTCPGVPILLVDIQRSRMNPLWSSKKPRTVEGESFEGKCLRCDPVLARNKSSSSAFLAPPTHSKTMSSRSLLASCHSNNSSKTSFNALNSSNHSDGSKSARHPSPSSSASVDMTRLAANGSDASKTTIDGLITATVTRVPSERAAWCATSRGSDKPPTCGPRRVDYSTSLGCVAPSPTRSPPSRTRSESSPLTSSTTTTSLLGRPKTAVSSFDIPSGTQETMMSTVRDFDSLEESKTEEKDFFEDSMISMMHASIASLDLAPSQPIRHVSGQSDEAPVDVERIVADLKALVDGMKTDDSLFEVLVEILISSMDMHQSLEPVQHYCLEIMADVFKDAVMESPVPVSKIVRAMESLLSSVNVQTAGCGVIRVLAENNANLAVLVQSGACRCITKALSRHIGEDSFVGEAVGVLRMISLNSDARISLQCLETSKHVAQAMRCNASSAQIQRDGSAFLSNLSIDPEKRSVADVSADILEAILGALESHMDGQQVVASACFALKNLSFSEPNLRTLSKIPGAFGLLENAVSAEGGDDAYDVLEKMQVIRAEDESLEMQVNESVLALVDARKEDDSVVTDVSLPCC